MSKLIWEDELVFYLIDMIKSQEYVWNPKNPFYRSKLKRRKFWVSVVKEINRQFNRNVPITYEEVLRKWNNLKSYFGSHNQRILKAKLKGASTEEIENIRSNWRFKSTLEFLSTVQCNSNLARGGRGRPNSAFEKRSHPKFVEFEELSATSIRLSPNTFDVTRFLEQNMVRPNTPTEERRDSLTDSRPEDGNFVTQSQDVTWSMSIKKESGPKKSPDISKKLTKEVNSINNLNTRMSTPTNPNSNSEISSDSNSETNSQTNFQTNQQPNSQPYTQANTNYRTDNSVFGACISKEIDNLCPKQQINAKKQIFSFVMDLQAEQIKEN